MTRRVLRTLALSIAVFFTASAVTVVLAAWLAPGWKPGARLNHLRPQPVAAPQPITMPQPVATLTRTQTTIEVPGGSTRAVLVSPAAAQRPTTAIVLVGGSGASTRQQLLPLAEEFATLGITALAYDKSTADYSMRHRDYAALGADAMAAAAALRQRTGAQRVGLLGISEGGWAVTAAAGTSNTASTRIDFAVLASAPVLSPLEQASWVVDHAITAAPSAVRKIPAVALAGGSTVVDYLDFDSAPYLQSIRVPVYAIWGAADATLPVNAAYRALSASLSGPLAATIVPGLGHDLLRGTDQWLPAVAAWTKTPTGSVLVGAEPDSDLGTAVPPAGTWFTDPRLHLALSAAAALAAGVLAGRRTVRRPTRQPRR